MKKTLMIATLSAIFAFAGASLITTFANESKTTNTTVESSTSTKTEKQSRTLPDYATLLATETISLAEAEKIALEAVPNATIIEYDYHLAHKNDETPTYSFELQNGTTLTEVTINAVDGSITETETTTESTTYPNATITFEQAQTTALSTVADASVVGFKFNGDTTTPSYTFTLFANDTTTRVTIDALTGEQIESAAKGSRKTTTESTTETATETATETTTESTTETNSTSSATPSA